MCVHLNVSVRMNVQKMIELDRCVGQGCSLENFLLDWFCLIVCKVHYIFQKKFSNLRSGLKSDGKLYAKDPNRINNRIIFKKFAVESWL